MADRLHPQDIRAIVAAIAHHAYGQPKFTDPVREADALLAELERTAPKADPIDPALERKAQRLREAQGIVAEVRANENGKLADEMAARAAENLKLFETSQAQLAEARAEGAKAERERVIALLVAGVSAAPFPRPVLVFDVNHDLQKFSIGEEFLRYALEAGKLP